MPAALTSLTAVELRPTETEIQRHRVQRWFAMDDHKTHTEKEWAEHEAVGYLVLTNERLIFEPTRFEKALRRKRYSIPLRVLNFAAIFSHAGYDRGGNRLKQPAQHWECELSCITAIERDDEKQKSRKLQLPRIRVMTTGSLYRFGVPKKQFERVLRELSLAVGDSPHAG